MIPGYANIFQAEKEWERPRIIIDNRCTMHSRVRAFLYNENVDQLVDEMTDSIEHLMDMGCTRIILACNTSHLFLPKLYQAYPEAEKTVMSIIDVCVQELEAKKVNEVYLLASEGTIDSRIYQNALQEIGINCIVPAKEDYEQLRACIEAVKQKKYSDEVKDTFLSLVERNNSCILGCTELPILYEKYQNGISCKNIFDPLYLAIKKLKEEYNQ